MGQFQADLYADPQINNDHKYRNAPYVRGTEKASRIAVSNGNFSNKNLWENNSVELGVSWRTAQESNYIVITHSITDPEDPDNIIPWTKIAGEISSTEYINDNNCNIAFIVDAYTSAQMTKDLRGDFFTNAMGLCVRTHLTYPLENSANCLPEPFSGSDTSSAEFLASDAPMSWYLNEDIKEKWHIDNVGDDVIANGYCFVLWISNFAATTIKRCGGVVEPWVLNACAPPNPNNIYEATKAGGFIDYSLKTTMLWYGSYATGFPTVWDDLEAMNTFIHRILNTVGQEIRLEPYGLGSLSSVTKWATIQDGYFTSMGKTQYDKTDPMKQTQIITSDDIFRIQILPRYVAEHAQEKQKLEVHLIDVHYGLDNFNPMKDERDTVLPDGTVLHDYSKSKIMQFPYWWFQCVTNIGNTIDIMPQTKFIPLQNQVEEKDYIWDFMLKCQTRFIGGNNPRLMLSILDYTNSIDDIGDDKEWVTIWEFPSIPWQSNVSSEQQLQELALNMQSTANIYNSIIGESVNKKGLKYGYYSKFNTLVSDPKASAQGTFRGVGSMFGSGFRIAENVVNAGAGATILPKYMLDAEINQMNASGSANAIIGSSPTTIIGAGSIGALLTSPIKIIRRGYTDSELFGFARFLDRYGQSTYAYLNPITNAGDILGGNAEISEFGGKTYYEYHDIDIEGTMPVLFKNKIASLFITGVYLINE